MVDRIDQPGISRNAKNDKLKLNKWRLLLSSQTRRLDWIERIDVSFNVVGDNGFSVVEKEMCHPTNVGPYPEEFLL